MEERGGIFPSFTIKGRCFLSTRIIQDRWPVFPIGPRQVLQPKQKSYICMCTQLCVCVRVREREKKGGKSLKKCLSK